VRVANEKLKSFLSEDKKSAELKKLQLDGNKTYDVLRFPLEGDQDRQGEVVFAAGYQLAATVEQPEK
jgi:ssRNA-specific RNase YbeY (16S rRNA maturation enzyme)